MWGPVDMGVHIVVTGQHANLMGAIEALKRIGHHVFKWAPEARGPYADGGAVMHVTFEGWGGRGEGGERAICWPLNTSAHAL